MKLHHLLETPVDDRNLISISSALAVYLSSIPNPSPGTLGSLGELVGVELAQSLSSITIQLLSHSEMQQLLASDEDAGYEDGEYEAMWDVDNNTIGVVVDLLQSPNNLRIAITHELRHALDDVKSSNAAGDSYQYNKNDGSKDSYLAEPAEINARYAEAMHLLTGVLRKAYIADPTTARAVAVGRLPQLFSTRDISRLFPEGTKSAAYRRLLSRGAAFIDTELSRLRRIDSRKNVKG